MARVGVATKTKPEAKRKIARRTSLTLVQGGAASDLKSRKTVNASAVLTNSNNVAFLYDSLEEAFPDVDPGLQPGGTNILVQVRQPKNKTKGGIILEQSARSTEHYNTQVGKVVGMGKMAFKSVLTSTDEFGKQKQSLAEWPEGAWYSLGEYVRMPKYGGDRFSVPYEYFEMRTDPDTGRQERVTVKDEVIFAVFRAKDIIGIITGNPLAVKSYID